MTVQIKDSKAAWILLLILIFMFHFSINDSRLGVLFLDLM
jgi:hypothetical protein